MEDLGLILLLGGLIAQICGEAIAWLGDSIKNRYVLMLGIGILGVGTAALFVSLIIFIVGLMSC